MPPADSVHADYFSLNQLPKKAVFLGVGMLVIVKIVRGLGRLALVRIDWGMISLSVRRDMARLVL